MRSIIACLIACSTLTSARADFIIDTFDTGDYSASTVDFLPVGINPVFTSLSPTPAETVGGLRKWQVNVTQHDNASSRTSIFDVGLLSGGGFVNERVFGITNDFSQNAEVSLRWDGTDNNSVAAGSFAAPVDLSEGGVNQYLVLGLAETDQLTTYRVEVFDGDSSAAVTNPLNAPQVSFFNFSDFAGVDFSDVRAITLTINGPTAYDVALANFVASRAVPEPSSAALMGLACFGLTMCRRRRTS